MFKNSLFFLLALCGVILTCGLSARAQETEFVIHSAITEAKLPTGAQRVMAASVPAGVNEVLKKLVAAGEGKLVQGEAEVLAWADAGYRKADAPILINQLTKGLQTQGWTYELGGQEGDLTVFSVLKEGTPRRVVLGFFVPTDDALVLAWTEVLPADGRSNPATAYPSTQSVAFTPAPAAAVPGELVGTWANGGMSMLLERNTVTGSTTPHNGSRFKYVFTADNRFEAIGLMQSTMYGCTTTLFNDKRGTIEVNGSQLTLIPSKNFWRQQNSCAPNSNKERDYTLERETFTWRTKTDEYGKKHICLANAKGETCYRQEER